MALLPAAEYDARGPSEMSESGGSGRRERAISARDSWIWRSVSLNSCDICRSVGISLATLAWHKRANASVTSVIRNSLVMCARVPAKTPLPAHTIGQEGDTVELCILLQTFARYCTAQADAMVHISTYWRGGIARSEAKFLVFWRGQDANVAARRAMRASALSFSNIMRQRPSPFPTTVNRS